MLRKNKIIAMITMIILLAQIMLSILPTMVIAVEETVEEITRNYEIKEEETWDISENNDGSVIAKWTRDNKTIVISGSGNMKDWEYLTEEAWRNTKYNSAIKTVIIEEGIKSIGKYAFSECKSLSNITIPDSVTEIGYEAFSGCSSLKNIKIPQGVTEISSGLFWRCTSLESIEIPDEVTVIENDAFMACSSLKNIIIPEGVTNIYMWTFAGCTSLKSIGIPKGVTSIENDAFENCTSLESINVSEQNVNYTSENGILFSKDKTTLITYPAGKKDLTEYNIPEGVTSIESYAFFGCNSLKSIGIPEGVTEIQDNTFYGCSSLENITIPEGTTRIGSVAFFECNSLKNINIPDSIKSIESSAFYGCNSLNGITIPESVTKIEDYAIEKTTIIYAKADSEGHRYAEENEIGYILDGNANNISTNFEIKNEETWDVSENNDGSVIAKWTSNDKTLVISGSGSMEDWKYTSKEDWHNTQYTNAIENVIIQGDVTNIGVYAFYECKNLENATISKKVNSINRSAFEECSGLKSILIPEGITNICYDTFHGCSSLESVTIPSTVTDIGSYVFSECKSLKNIVIPKSVISIGSGVFYGCSSLENISVSSENNNFISENGVLFTKDKKNLITYPAAKTEFSKYIVPAEVTHILAWAFDGCIGLESIIIQEGLTNIEVAAFKGCSNLKDITIPEGVTTIGDSAFDSCNSLENIIIPEGVTSIEDWAFDECTKLKSIIIPESVINIGDYYSIYESAIIYTKENTEAHRYAETNERGYILDDVVPEVKMEYSTTEETAGSVIVTITSNEQMQAIQGWTLSEDKLTLTKEYNSNTEEEITIKDLVGNETTVNISIKNIITTKGDINQDGQINTLDMIRVLRNIAASKSQATIDKYPTWQLQGQEQAAADINGDGKINTMDLLKILRHISATKDSATAEAHPDWIIK